MGILPMTCRPILALPSRAGRPCYVDTDKYGLTRIIGWLRTPATILLYSD